MTKDHSARVLSNAQEAPAYWRLRVRISENIALRPGQFVMVRTRDQWEPIWRRALVIYRAERHAEGMDLEFLYKVLGRGTQRLSRQRPGDELEMLGPLGNGFPPETDPHAEALLVSGGIGLPALYLLAEALAHEGRSVRLFHGEPTVKPHAGSPRDLKIAWGAPVDLPALEDFARVLGREAITLATEDGSGGIQGLVTEALQAYLDRARPRRAVLYACGPLPMLRRVAEIAAAAQLPAFVALEARMACGFGVCLGCVVPTRSRSDRIPHYRRVCVEGPIFRAEEVLWDEL